MNANSSLSAEMHVVESRAGKHLFVTDGSRIYDLDLGSPVDPESLAALLTPLGERRIGPAPLVPPALQSLSLNVAQSCNLSCGYCYADEGRFQKHARLMPEATALAAVDRLIAESAPGASLLVGFMGGEPLVNRSLIHRVAAYAEETATTAGRSVQFSMTTNATLIRSEDAALFGRHRFHVTVSMDGRREANDAARPMKNGGSTHEHILRALELLDLAGRPRSLSARMTVTRESRYLRRNLEHLFELGFDSAGFSPVLVSPKPLLAMTRETLDSLLVEMIECGTAAMEAVRENRRYPFTNFETAMAELHRGSHRPYPCGAGAGYLSVNAEGEMYACHRLVDNKKYLMGTVDGGSDVTARADHLAARHVDRQEPCRSCWARYLCGGGCYHEVDARGRMSCDFVRGWLSFCIASYAELTQATPHLFDAASSVHIPEPIAL